MHQNAILIGQVDSVDSDLVNVINAVSTDVVLYNINYTEFTDKDDNSFADAQAAADYITDNGNVDTHFLNDGDVETYNWNEISPHLTNFQLGRHCIDDDDE